MINFVFIHIFWLLKKQTDFINLKNFLYLNYQSAYKKVVYNQV